MGKLILFLIFLISNISNGAINSPHGAVVLNPNAYSILISEYLFSTNGYYDSKGHEDAMVADTAFTLSDTEFNIGYGVSDKIELSGMARIRRVASTVVVLGNTQSLTKLGIESAQIGFKYSLPKIENNLFSLGGHFRKTLHTNLKYDPPASAPTDVIALGDDGTEYSIDFNSAFLYPKNRIDFEVSYVRPPMDLSQEINYKIEGLHQFESLGIIAGIQGILSLKKDPFTSDTSLKPQISRGSTKQFNSTNREKMEVYTGLGIDFKKFSLDARGGMTLSGVSTDKGYFALFSMQIKSQGTTEESVKVESFKEYHIDGSVLKISARGNFIKIDQGLSTDVEKGMQFDIFQTDYFGGNILVATGVVFEVGSDSSVIKLSKRYNNIEIKPGFAARGR